MRRETKLSGVILDERCSVTAFDLHLQLRHDGGGAQPPGSGRGVWFYLVDESKARRKAYEQWHATIVDHLHEQHFEAGFRHSLALSDIGHLLKKDINEGLLMEWDEVEVVHKALGEVLEARRKHLAAK